MSAAPRAQAGTATLLRALWAAPLPRAALLLLGLIVAAVLVGPLLLPQDAAYIDFAADWGQPPSLAHPLGTDALGRDLLARLLAGGRTSLAVALAATLVSSVIGVAWGAVAGYAGGRSDALMMRAVDLLYALPFMFIVVLLTAAFGRHLLLVFIAIGLVNWLDMARIVRGQTLALRSRPFIVAAQVSGAPPAAILRRHLLPNLAAPIIVCATLTVPQVVLIESFLSFLGLGVQAPATSWGALIQDGAREMEVAPWALLFPALLLGATLLALNVIGEALRTQLEAPA